MNTPLPSLSTMVHQLASHRAPAEPQLVYVPGTDQRLAVGAVPPLMLQVFRIPKQGGLAIPVSVEQLQTIPFTASYITIDDYMSPVVTNEEEDLDRSIALLSSIGSFRQRISVSTLLNDIVLDGHHLESLTQQYLARLEPAMAELLRSQLDTQDGNPRVLLSRQGVLTAIREIIRRYDDEREDIGPTLESTIALVHAVSVTLYDRERSHRDDPTMEDGKNRPQMEFIRSHIFYQQNSELPQLARCYLLWTKYGDSIVRTSSPCTPTELLAKATGLDIQDLFAFGFAMLSPRIARDELSSWSADQMWITKSYFPASVDQELLDSFLSLVSANPATLIEEFDKSDSPWNFLPFQKWPVLRVGDQYLILDLVFFLERITDGLFYDVNTYEKNISEQQRNVWTQVYGEMLELYVADLVRMLAPRDLATGGRFVYMEEHFREAFSGKICDTGIDYGREFCAIEVVSGRVKVETRVTGQVDSFDDDTERLVIDKARQLHEISLSILDNEAALTGTDRVSGREIVPILVNVGSYPVNHLSTSVIQRRLDEEGLLQDSRMVPLSIISIYELELLLLILESSGQTVPCILRAWQESDLVNMPLYVFLYTNSYLSEADGRRLWPVAQEDIVQLVIDRLGLAEDHGVPI